MAFSTGFVVVLTKHGHWLRRTVPAAPWAHLPASARHGSSPSLARCLGGEPSRGLQDLGTRTLLGAPGIATNKKLLGAPGIATRSKDATSNKCIASSNSLTSSNKDAPSNKKLLVTRTISGSPGLNLVRAPHRADYVREGKRTARRKSRGPQNVNHVGFTAAWPPTQWDFTCFLVLKLEAPPPYLVM